MTEMIIKEIYIDGFGIYNDFSLNNLKSGINIILGNNEAGKSTLLKFIRYTLFGYPRLRENRMAPLRGGAHGGKIKALLSSGNEITIDRKGSGRLALFFSGRESGNEGDLFQLLGNISSSLYSNVYAFTLDELVSLTSLSDSGVEDKIFSVGMGLGDLSLAEVESDLRGIISEIYRSAGRNQLIPEILNYLDERRTELTEKRQLLPERNRLSAELELTERQYYELDNIYKEKLSEKNRLENYIKCHESVIRLLNAEKELEQLPAPGDYPENGLQQIEVLGNKINELEDALSKLKDGSEGEKGIAELNELAGSVRYNQALLDEQGKVDYLRSNLNGYRTARNDFVADAAEEKNITDRITDIISNVNADKGEESVEAISGLDIHRAAINSYRQKNQEILKKKVVAETNLEALRHREGSLNVTNIAVLVSVIFFIGSVPAFYYGFIVAGIALILGGIVVFAGRKSLTGRSSIDNVKQELDELEERERQLMSDYRGYIADKLNICRDIPIDAAEELLTGIERAKELIKQKRSIEIKQNQQRKPFIVEFESIAVSLESFIREGDKSGNTVIIVSQIISEYDSSLEEKRKKTVFGDELKRKQLEAGNILKKIEETRAAIEKLLAAADSKDIDEFRRKYNIDMRVRKLIEERSIAEQTIESITGIGKSGNIVSFFRNRGKDQVLSDIEVLIEAIDELNNRLKDHARKIGELKNEIRRVEEKSDMAGVMTGIETGKERLRKAAGEWITGRIALELLTGVKAEYEREKQPAVISNAARYFSSVTGGRYKRLHVSLGDKDVQVYDETGTFKTTGQLSRGAKEQLLVSLRLGFIDEYEKNAEPLPVIIDEILVNFDPGRAKRMAEVLSGFSKNRQLLLFSCHPETPGLFRSSDVNLINLDG
jgi:uncharacterized protein YhaN